MANQIICPNCGRRNAAYRRVCRACQTVLVAEPAATQTEPGGALPPPAPLDANEMGLISMVVALLLACFTGFWILNYGNGEMAAAGEPSILEQLLLVCPVSLFGLVGSALVYQLWWHDRSHSYALLGVLLLLVLAGGLIAAWLIVSLLASA